MVNAPPDVAPAVWSPDAEQNADDIETPAATPAPQPSLEEIEPAESVEQQPSQQERPVEQTKKAEPAKTEAAPEPVLQQKPAEAPAPKPDAPVAETE